MSNNNDMKTEVIIPGNEKNDKIFLIVYKELKGRHLGKCNVNLVGELL